MVFEQWLLHLAVLRVISIIIIRWATAWRRRRRVLRIPGYAGRKGLGELVRMRMSRATGEGHDNRRARQRLQYRPAHRLWRVVFRFRVL